MANQDSKKQSVFKDEGTETDDKTATASGLEENLLGLLCYVAWAITGIIFLFVEKENKFVRFHAIQSIGTSIAILVLTTVLSVIPVIGWIISLLLSPAILVLWLFMMWKAYKGEWFKLPFIGDFAEKQANN